jgi:hypothetical protein
MPKKKPEMPKIEVVGGAEIDINQMAKMYFGFGIMPWSFVLSDPYYLKAKMDAADAIEKNMLSRR